jgi:ribosome-associated heat shock protein Hsp15
VDTEVKEQRLDVWLDVACLFRTRSEAQKACKGGKVEVNREPGKQTVVVGQLAEHHVPKAQARELYRDITPPPSPEEIELRRLGRLVGVPRPAGRPDKRERRALRKIRGF